MVLFTHGDQLEDKNIHTFVWDNPKLPSFIKACSGRYDVFNNKEQNPEQREREEQRKREVVISGRFQGEGFVTAIHKLNYDYEQQAREKVERDPSFFEELMNYLEDLFYRFVSKARSTTQDMLFKIIQFTKTGQF